MRITGSIPIHIARAYNIVQARPAAPVQQTHQIAQSQRAEKVDAYKPSESVQQLIAGNVSGPVDFISASTPTSQAGAYQLYTRAADKIEAATAVQIGQSIDITG